MTRRLEAMGQERYAGLTTKKHFNGKIKTHDDVLAAPLRWKKPSMVFVNSMSDLFHEAIPDQFIRMVFAVMSVCGQHTFQVLTKRPERMAAWFADDENSLSACQAELVASDWWCNVRPHRTPTNRGRIRDTSQINGTCRGVGDGNYWPLGNVWLGTSVENRDATTRIEHLRAVPAATRFLSCEPLLGQLGTLDLAGIHWVIVGGESGRGARPMHPDWAREIRDQCIPAGVAFFFKQWGAWMLGSSPRGLNHFVLADGTHGTAPQEMGWSVRRSSREWHTLNPQAMARVGKKAAGRVLDGRVWDEMPGGL